ncbi:toxin-antitoxin system, toxin component [Streptomyces sp. NPDC048290]|uniref:toxin-antitoxin system, toxin component n=1 Tax=Streptomyces sp. NPDC048290 TaxID=3155811 RepID=UPI0034417F29
MRRLCGELVAELILPAPAPPADLYRALCAAMSRRRGRPVLFRTAVFPRSAASGLWIDLADQDLVVVEERTAPDHQLVILGHELWHMAAGHHGHPVQGAEVAARLLRDTADLQAAVRAVAARTRFDLAEERDAEVFGLLLASRCRGWLAGAEQRGQRDDLAGRIEASLGYPGRE